MTLRARLVILVLALLVPMVAFATMTIVAFGRQQRAAVQNGAVETARALLNAVDQSLGSSIATLEALATLSSLDRGGRTPAIALTAYGRAQNRMRSLTAGYNMHVPKPVDPGELTTIIASLAGRHEPAS